MKTTKHIFLAAALCLCTMLNTFGESRPYSGRPATPTQISSENYATFGFSASNYQAYIGWYAISNAEELYGFAALVNNRNSEDDVFNGVLTADIVVNENVLKADGTLNGTPTHSWTPIGTSGNKFAGKFDGQGHTISGLYFSNTGSGNYPTGGNYVGLFGRVSGSSCKISNAGLVDSYIRGYRYVGGICGYASSSTITNCYNAGTVIGNNNYVGGICSEAYSSTITNCHNTGTITGGSDHVGGICGYAYSSSTIANCYNTGTITGSSYYVGGVCGCNGSSTITNCYYLLGCAKDGNNVVQYGVGNITKGQTNTDASLATLSATTEEFASGKIAYMLNSKTSGGTIWRQNLTGNVDAFPVLDKNHSVVYASQPCAIRFANSEMATEDHNYENGICSECGEYEAPSLVDGWYLIDNANKLYWFAEAVNTGNADVFGKLTADIVVNENVLKNGSLNGTPTRSWTPIGTFSKKFEGKFDGQGHTISGLYFSNANEGYFPSGGTYVGLFGYANELAEISNVGIIDSYFNGYMYVGGICGKGTVTNCFNTGTITAGTITNGRIADLGGICGSGTATNCYNSGEIQGYRLEDIGGICGNGTAINCHNAGRIIGDGLVGGVCGRGGASNCYNTGSVTANQYYNVGGICGSGNPINCYNIGNVNGRDYNVGGICGAGTPSNCYYLTGCAKDGSNIVQYGIGNRTNGQTTADIDGKTTSVTVVELASGKIAYLLNNSISGGTTWYQNLSGETDASPVLENYHKKVFGECGNVFTNNPEQVQYHDYDENGVCSVCGETITMSEDGYYEISNVSALYWFASMVNSGKANINGKLTADIVVNENVLSADGELNGTPTHSWTPIGTYSKMFSGKFDGQGHTISGLYFNNTNKDNYPKGGTYVGLFGCVQGKTEISNVGIIDSYFHAYKYVGGICGDGNPIITNCYNAGTILGTDGSTGGICGRNSSTIMNCYNIGLVKCNRFVGGICGYMRYGTAITNCYNSGTIIATDLSDREFVAGGICAYFQGSSIKNCYNTGELRTDLEGSIYHSICGILKGSITNCFFLVCSISEVDNGITEMGQTPATDEEFASGKVAYLLNGSVSEGELAWYQTLPEDVSPVLDATHDVVTGYIDEIDNIITVNGNWVVTTNYEIAVGKTLFVGDGASVTIAEGAELTNYGTITNNSTFTNNGAFSLTGTITGNDLEGSGKFTYTNLSDSDIETASNGYAYKGTAYTLESGLSDIVVKARTICGKQFTFDATGYTVSYENNLNVGNNAKIIWSGSSTVEKTFAIIPNTNVVVTITGNSSTVAYNTEEQSINGYTVEIEDETGVYTENDFTFSGSAVASGTTVGTYAMELSADDFSNTNANFAEVQFVVTDGVLTINKAENAPDMPTTIETYYINTNRVALPDNWQWTEDVDLEMGENTATAEYIGEDADNYENVSVEVVVTRTACPHDEGYTTINTAEPTCTEEGYTGDHLCNICNEVFEQGEAISANGHTYSNTVTTPTCTEIGYTTHTCSVCEFTYNSDTVAAKGHEADSVVFENIVAATCAAAGSRDSVVYCSVCQAEVSRAKEEVAKLPHTEVVDAAIAATCTTAGKTEGKHCSVCNEVIVAQTEIPALGHEFKDYVYNNDATTTADGTETATCSRCGEKDTRTATGTKLEKTPEKGTAVGESAANEVNIYAHGNILVIENATEEICVYNAMGTLVCMDAMPCVRAEVNIPTPGVYIVKTGGVVKRVMINEQ